MKHHDVHFYAVVRITKRGVIAATPHAAAQSIYQGVCNALQRSNIVLSADKSVEVEDAEEIQGVLVDVCDDKERKKSVFFEPQGNDLVPSDFDPRVNIVVHADHGIVRDVSCNRVNARYIVADLDEIDDAGPQLAKMEPADFSKHSSTTQHMPAETALMTYNNRLASDQAKLKPNPKEKQRLRRQKK